VKPAVFLDRDGTIIEDVGYLESIHQIALYPWTIDAIRMLNRAALPVVVITNQSGVARGRLTEALVQQTHRVVDEQLAAGDARIDAYYYCPHHPEGAVAEYACACDCRKPGRGLVDRAASDLALDPSRSFVVGDRWLDIGTAHAIGGRGVLVRTGVGADQEREPREGVRPDAIVDNLAAAVSWILMHVDRA